jgi:hypothetical protein
MIKMMMMMIYHKSTAFMAKMGPKASLGSHAPAIVFQCQLQEFPFFSFLLSFIPSAP